MNEKGYLDGTKMATAFNMLRSGDLIWPYVINNYMRGKEPLPFDLLYWNADSTRMARPTTPSTCATAISRTTCRRARWSLPGDTLSLGDIKIPVYNLASQAKTTSRRRARSSSARKYFGGEVEYVMAGSGHIAGVVNPPAVEEVPVLDRRQAGRRLRGLGRQGDGDIPAPGGRTGRHWIEAKDDTRVPARKPGKSR